MSKISDLMKEYFSAWKRAEPLQLSEIPKETLDNIIEELSQKIESSHGLKVKIQPINDSITLSNLLLRLKVWQEIFDPIIRDKFNYIWDSNENKYIFTGTRHEFDDEHNEQLRLF